MLPADLCTWNAAKLAELGGDALEVAAHAVAEWPGVKITSAARDYKEQARSMAQNACAQRDGAKLTDPSRLKWIADTYWPSIAAMALQQWFEQHPTASEPDVVDGFVHLMRGLAPNELRALSKHIVMRERDEGDGTTGICIDDRAQAVDFEYVPGDRDIALCTYLSDEARARGGKFLPHEGKLTRRHWQAK
jgi:hypothetical protein